VTILRVGATPKYASNWEQAFSPSKKKTKGSRPPAKASSKSKKKKQNSAK
jgi:hypothetical protein